MISEKEKRENVTRIYGGTLFETREKIEAKIEETILSEKDLRLAFNRLFVHFRGYDKLDNMFNFEVGGVEYTMFHDLFKKRIYLGAMLGLSAKIA